MLKHALVGHDEETINVLTNVRDVYFLAILSHRSSPEKSIIDLTTPLFDKSLCSAAFFKLLKELRAK